MKAGQRGLPVYTPDGRYIVVDRRPWRTSNPNLSDAQRTEMVVVLMDARRAVGAAKRSGDKEAEAGARARVDTAKRDLGERGPVWWTDGEPDFNRRIVFNTPYAEWFASLRCDANDKE